MISILHSRSTEWNHGYTTRVDSVVPVCDPVAAGYKVQWIMDATPKGRFMEAELEPYAQQHVVGILFTPPFLVTPTLVATVCLSFSVELAG